MYARPIIEYYSIRNTAYSPRGKHPRTEKELGVLIHGRKNIPTPGPFVPCIPEDII